MQHSGIPTKTHQEGYAARYAETAVHRTFQIKTFSTELKNHVMVMDFVKSNWFPSQRRAKVCIIHMCQGLKMAEQTASRYEIHSRLFSSPKDHSAWERNESLSNAGLRDNYHSRRDQIALKNLQSDVTEAKSDFTKETLASQNTKMISSIVISQMIDENKSRENRVSLPLPCAIAQSHAHHAKQSLANCSGVNIHRAFALLPGRLGIPASSDERGPETELPPKEESPCGGPRRGFASITITARRVGPPASALVWGTVGDSLCPKCRAEDTPFQAPPALANGAHPGWHQRSFACTEFSRNSSVVRLKVPEAHTGLCERRKYWVTHADDKETSFSPDTPLSGKSPLVFSSCVHLRVSQRCPNSIYYVDKSLSVPIEPPQIASPKMHRSVLSLNLNCSSHRLTADGVDGLVNREPISGALKQELVEGDQDLVGQRWNLGLQESHLKETPSLGRVHSGTGACPWSGSFPLENTELANVGANHVTARKGEKDHATHCHASSHANQLSIHIPGWSYSAACNMQKNAFPSTAGHNMQKSALPPAVCSMRKITFPPSLQHATCRRMPFPPLQDTTCRRMPSPPLQHATCRRTPSFPSAAASHLPKGDSKGESSTHLQAPMQTGCSTDTQACQSLLPGFQLDVVVMELAGREPSTHKSIFWMQQEATRRSMHNCVCSSSGTEAH
ncbi:(E2-independent) E3 ubiquitin-conjugating enzyme FATS isoform X2 [Nomascus leucogenys]|uniref:(E2-independent) E3 ubiquitin-conjugating enzyme FATS isoform X2 n=1 Tax=Nomascus leucogenys TaxID=61853 RepID=UPI00122DB048|nr:(E2-independent) E3 ubiquitin-conjugating enzyme FATS isoform X2 [Nomascus leucogenys]